MEVYVDDESKLTLVGLVQHFIMLTENEKNRRLCDVLDALDFNQVYLSSIPKFDDLPATGGHFREVCVKGQGAQHLATLL